MAITVNTVVVKHVSLFVVVDVRGCGKIVVHVYAVACFHVSYLPLSVNDRFDPPGSMSAGLTCKMVVIFQPKVCCSHFKVAILYFCQQKCSNFFVRLHCL